MKFNEKVFNKAENIAHSYYWLSDCPSIREAVKKYVEKSNSFKGGVSNYVALICLECANQEYSLSKEEN
jgi:hypothetical protein